MRFLLPLHALSLRVAAAALLCSSAALASLGCSVDTSRVFGDTGAGNGGNSGGGGSGGAGGQGGATTTSGTTGSTTSSTTGSTTSSTTTSSTTTSTTTTTTTTGPVCGNGACEPGETSGNCPGDCPVGNCAHDVCQFGEPLQNGCSACVSAICAQDPSCCGGGNNPSWHGGCLSLANQLCNNVCCGNGQCAGEDCNNCTADCGSCPPGPTCPHRICFGGNNAAPLNTTLCYDPCIDGVCADINPTTDNCCIPEPPSWSAECTALQKSICGEYKCIKDICDVMPSCCATAWTQACVQLAANTPSCDTNCDCSHGICSNGGALNNKCDPCVTAICKVDPYCCDTNWDGICVGEVGTICGIICN